MPARLMSKESCERITIMLDAVRQENRLCVPMSTFVSQSQGVDTDSDGVHFRNPNFFEPKYMDIWITRGYVNSIKDDAFQYGRF